MELIFRLIFIIYQATSHLHKHCIGPKGNVSNLPSLWSDKCLSIAYLNVFSYNWVIILFKIVRVIL